MKKPYRRILISLASSVVFIVIAIAAGLGNLLILPFGGIIYYDIQDVWRSVDPLPIAVVAVVLSFTTVFWLILTIWTMLAELVRSLK